MPSLMKSINAISRCAGLYRGDRLEGTELGAPHHSYLLYICRHPGVPQETIAKEIYINKSNVTRQLAYLEKCGYVERRQSDKDKRMILVYPTQKALDAMPLIHDIIRDWNAYLTEELTAEERDMLEGLLAVLANRAKRYVSEAMALEETTKGNPKDSER